MKTELSEVLPFQSLFGWFMLLPGGWTKDLVRKIYFGILSITLVLKFKQSTKYFCKSKQLFLYAVYTKSFVLVEPVIATRNPAKIRELKNHDDDFVDHGRKWDTMYCASAASKFRRRGLVNDAKHSSVTSSCFTSFGRYESSVFRRFFKCSLHFFVFVNPGILSFFS